MACAAGEKKRQESAMIKDVMVWMDGSVADEIRLDAAASIARQFESHVIVLILNPLPVPIEGLASPASEVELLEKARAGGDRTEAMLVERLRLIDRPTEIRRFDVLANDIAGVAAREARAADTFVALRPNGSMDPARLVEGVLFESGRHMYLFPESERPRIAFDRILVAWNGSREAARAMAESIPFLKKAKEVTVVVITDKKTEGDVLAGANAVEHLKRHDINAVLRHVTPRNSKIGDGLLAEAHRRKADLIVMGGYGHSRLREWLLGGVTHSLMHEAPLPLVIAH
jgi:nucleotide-binding universal stress UspA family protein